MPNQPYRILINGSSGSGKTYLLVNLINHSQKITKYVYTQKIPWKKYQFLIKKRERDEKY